MNYLEILETSNGYQVFDQLKNRYVGEDFEDTFFVSKLDAEIFTYRRLQRLGDFSVILRFPELLNHPYFIKIKKTGRLFQSFNGEPIQFSTKEEAELFLDIFIESDLLRE